MHAVRKDGKGCGDDHAHIRTESARARHEAAGVARIRTRSFVDEPGPIRCRRTVVRMFTMVLACRHGRSMRITARAWAEPAGLNQREVRKRENGKESS